MVDVASGRIDWTLGGRNSSFKMGPGARFEWQHDVRVQPHNRISLFDDHCCQQTGGGTYVDATGPSRALILNVDHQAGTATVAAQFGQKEGFETDYMGATREQSNGNVFVGWGSSPYFSEFDRSGKVLLEGELPGPDLGYRATVEQWDGQPVTLPAGAARQSGSHATVYASWNGATRVASWRVLAGPAGQLTAVGTAPRSGFETAIPLARSYPSFQLQALDGAGKVLATSHAFAPQSAK